MLRSAAYSDVALKCYEESTLTWVKAAWLAKISIKAGMKRLANLGVVVVDESTKCLVF